MSSNERLLDVLTRHQIYVEGVKSHFARDFDDVMRKLDETLSKMFKRLRVDRLDELTKKQLNEFLFALQTEQQKIYSVYVKHLIDSLIAFMGADLLVSKVLFATLEREDGKDDKPVSEADATGALLDAIERKDGAVIFPFAYLTGSEEANAKLWSKIINSPIPANGMLLLPFITVFTNSASNSIRNLIVKGYANSQTPKEILDEILGTPGNNYRDGQLTRVGLQDAAVTATLVQHVTAIVQAGVASGYHGLYMWASVIDGRTTPICRDRNEKVYEYGKGPLPPAHINCRSKAIPLKDSKAPDVPTFKAWIERQPKAFKSDYNSNAKGSGEDFTGFKSLSLEQFKSKVPLMLTRSDD